MDIVNALTRLCETPAVSGFERQGATVAAELLSSCCDSVEIDAFGNIVGMRRCGKENAKTVLLDAHLDQIGFVVTEVLDGGFLRFAESGGVDPRMLLGCEVTVLADEPLYGVIACMPPHLMKAGEQDKAVQIHEMLIDTGLIEAKTRVKTGTPVVFAERVFQLSKGSVTGKCLDDRAGIIAIAQAMEKLGGEELSVDVAVLISVQEETTSLGAGIGAYRIRPDFAIAVDVGHAKTPDAPSDKTFEYGGGVMVGMGPNLDTRLTRALIKTAKAEGIAYQQEVMEGHTGTNAWAMQIAAYGTAQGLLSIPLRYMHTPIESICLSDLDSVSDLLYHFLRNFDGEVRL
ncbi:M42 family metallopeptidase [Intestinibacillus massiliensis]|uniref:M42 family metallopeptidase n=1 Tax=Intestinibacillus massiliensis TaxID=1871029 RepID=UPI001F2B3DE7|nr:M20/M25/M40 family metallo-hydrolase [Intestinibacillus massiliensis]